VWVLVPLALGQPLDLLRLPQLVANAAFTASAGFSGWPLTDDPWPVVMFGHAAFVLLLAGFRGGAPAALARRSAPEWQLLVVWLPTRTARTPEPRATTCRTACCSSTSCAS
jgi:hypothetical protein